MSDATGLPRRKEGVADDGGRFALPHTHDVMEVCVCVCVHVV